jgi:CPA1 family monovalent cation:H+ antiporter
MHLVQGIVFVCLFLIGLCAIAHYFRNSPLPFVCWVVLFGVGYGILQKFTPAELPWIHLTPEVILYIFLPVLIFDSSRGLKYRASVAVAAPAIALATLGIVVSMFVMAVPIRFFSDLPWIDNLFLCAIMATTDPVAVSAVFKVFPVPEKLKMLVEGESLLNDGTTVILFSLLFGKVIEKHDFIFHQGILFFVLTVLGSIVLGGLAGWGCAALMRYWKALKSHFIAPLMPLLFVYLVFCAAQAWFKISGVITVMAATLALRIIMGRYPVEEMPGHMQREFYNSFWDFLGDLANAILFFMLGAEIGSTVGVVAWRFIGISLVALLFARSVVVYGFGAVFRLPLPWQNVLNLGGLKGALSVALILMIPKDYAFRQDFLNAALAMCIFTLVVNPLALRAYLKKAGFEKAG